MNDSSTESKSNESNDLVFHNSIRYLIKRKEVLFWSLIVPLLFYFGLNILFFIRDKAFLDPLANTLLIIGVIVLSLMMVTLVIFIETMDHILGIYTEISYLDLLKVIIAHLVYLIPIDIFFFNWNYFWF